jgi:hypothetical protein
MAEQTARTKREDDRKEALLELALKRWKIASDYESDMRVQALDDIRFAEGDQWDAQIREQRRLQGRPALTINRIPQFVQHITNEQRQNPISIQIDPVDSGADIETADILQGLVRHIQNQSNADEAYSNGFDYAVKGGWGYWRVITDYADEFSFEQEIYIKRVENPFDVYLDPGGTESDASDINWGFVVADYTKEQYKEQFPKSKYTAGIGDWVSTGNGWVQQDTMRVAEYFYREMQQEKIVQTSDGQILLWRTLPTLADGKTPDLPTGIRIVQTRTTQVPFVKWALINQQEVLEEREWAGKFIPIVKVIGQMTNIDGQRVYKGIVRDARDPQQQLNFMETAATEAIALSPKAPYFATPAMVQGFEKQYASMNNTNRPFLLYNPDIKAGGGPPQRNAYEAPIQAMMAAVAQASDDLKSTAGIYDAALGQGAGDVSGKAIQARQQQSTISAFHFGDNLKRSVKQTARILIDLIPFVYNSPQRVVRIIGEDGTQQTVQVNNQGMQDDQGNLPPGIEGVYNLTTGKYDVTINTGPDYQTKRQAAVDGQMELMKTIPNAAPLIADLVVSNMDIPQAQEISARLKTLLPPAIQAMEQKQTDIPPEFAQQYAQLQAQMQQLQQQLQQSATDLKYDLSKEQMRIQSDQTIAQAKIELERERIQASIITAELNAKVQQGQMNAQNEYDFLSQQIEQAHEFAMTSVDQAHQQGMAVQQQQAASQQQEPVQ